MNSQPQYSRKGSPMPFIIIILLLIGIITGLLVYHFMFYKPSLEVCSNLYASNICTTEYCIAEKLCPVANPPEWNPKIITKAGSLLGYGVELPTTGDFGTLYKTEIASLESVFDSNVCDTLTTMVLTDYHPPAAAGAAAETGQINCIKLLNKIDADLKNNSLSWIEESKLLEARNAVIDLCAPPDVASGARGAINADSFFPTTDITGKTTGKIAKLFCPPPPST